MIFNEEHKTLPINKSQVQQAFKKVRSNRGSPGVDGLTIEEVDNNPRKYLSRNGMVYRYPPYSWGPRPPRGGQGILWPP